MMMNDAWFTGLKSGETHYRIPAALNSARRTLKRERAMQNEITMDDPTGMTRRGFLATGGAGALAAALATAFAGRAFAEDAPAAAPAEGAKPAIDLPAREKANIDLVNEFCAAWATRDGAQVGAFFADDATFRMTEDAPPVQTRDAITKRLQGFLALAKKAEFEVIRSFAIGDIVIDERYDRFTMGTKDVAYHMVGVFFIRNGKIQEWFDYRMPA